MKKVAIIQARMDSTRLPDKVMLDIAGYPMLVRVVERTRRAKTVDAVVVATSTDTSDDAIETLCRQKSYPYFRGSSHDLLDRYYQAAKQNDASVIIRITADCPVIDPDVIDTTVNAFLGIAEGEAEMPTILNWDLAANRLPPPWGRSYPIGLDTEVCSFDRLQLAWQIADQPYQREHVMPFFYEQPDRFQILHVTHDPDYGSFRWTVDTPEDLELLREIFTQFKGRDDFSWLDVLDLFEQNPWLAKINTGVEAKHFRDTDQRHKQPN